MGAEQTLDYVGKTNMQIQVGWLIRLRLFRLHIVIKVASNLFTTVENTLTVNTGVYTLL